MGKQLLLSLLLVSLLLVSVPITGQNRALYSRGQANENEYLEGIRRAAYNESLFWFGTSYAARCRPELRHTVDCYKRLDQGLDGPQSIATILFGQDRGALDNLQYRINITYVSKPGSYSGCDTHYEQTTERAFSVDPLSGTAHVSWDVRDAPHVTWSPGRNGPGGPGMYTLLILDVVDSGNYGTIINIPGSEIARGQVIIPYGWPRFARASPSPLVFLVYRQKQIRDPRNFLAPGVRMRDLTRLVRDPNLDGPVGLSWVSVVHDAFSVGRQRAQGRSNNCASLVSAVYNTHELRPFLPRNYPLRVFMSLHFEAPPIRLPCRVGHMYQGAVNVTFDAIAKPTYPTAFARQTDIKIDLQLSMNKVGPEDTNDFRGKQYTLIELDPDVPDEFFRGYSSPERPLLHWAVINMEDGHLARGEIVKPYLRGLPPVEDPHKHTYYFLLFEQSQHLQRADVLRYTGDICSELGANAVERCLFDVNRFASSENLTLVGATWFTLLPDSYSACVRETDDLLHLI